jgi:hypothetical protein
LLDAYGVLRLRAGRRGGPGGEGGADKEAEIAALAARVKELEAGPLGRTPLPVPSSFLPVPLPWSIFKVYMYEWDN